MKKRVIRLTESDLEKIVRKVLSEQMPAPDMTKPVKYFTGTKQVESELGGMFNGRLLNFFDESETKPVLLKYKVNRVKSDENEPALKFEVSPTVKSSQYPKGVVVFECNNETFMFESNKLNLHSTQDPVDTQDPVEVEVHGAPVSVIPKKSAIPTKIEFKVYNDKFKSDLKRVFCSRLKKSNGGIYLSPSAAY